MEILMQIFAYKYILVVVMATVLELHTADLNQKESFRNGTQGPIGVLTTSSGAAVPYIEATNTLNSRLIYNEYFMESMSHFVQERLPERAVHAKGAGAFGHFIVTHNISAICRSKVFSEDGKKTPIAVRFSITMGDVGGSDTSRDGRGFAVRFYTEQGNYDLVGINIPVFAIKDPVLFSSFVHSQKRNPATNLHDPNMMWDFISLNPSSIHFYSYVFSNIGIPHGYRYMPGYGLHTFQVGNAHGEIYFIKFHIIPDSGIETLTSEQATKIQGVDFDFNSRDLYRDIETGNYPVWTLSIQVLTLEDVKKIGSQVFDITRIIPLDKYPLKPIGKIVLTRNPQNSFAEMEQLAMNPSNLVDGIYGAPDKLFEARALIYRDAQSYRLGVNFNKIDVNCPYQTRPLVYNRDGRPPLGDNGKDVTNYYPNSFNGPVPYNDSIRVPLIKIKEEKPNNFDQIRRLYKSMNSDERNRLIDNIISSIRPVVRNIQQRVIQIFKSINEDIGRGIEIGLFTNSTNNDPSQHYF